MPLGCIVQARVLHKWDEHKADYIDGLMRGAKENAQKTQLEAIRFAADGLTAVHKLIGDRWRKFIQTGRPEDLEDQAKQMNLKTYQQLVALFMQLTGQDVKKAGPSAAEPMAPAQAAKEDEEVVLNIANTSGSDLLKMIAEANKGKK